MKTLRDIAKEIVDFTSTTPLYPAYQVDIVEKILEKYFKGDQMVNNFYDVCDKHKDILLKKGGNVVGKVNEGIYCNAENDNCKNRAKWIIAISENMDK